MVKKLEKLQLEADPGSIDYSDERYMTVQNLFKIENKINNLIDLVNSQQEAIEKLEKRPEQPTTHWYTAGYKFQEGMNDAKPKPADDKPEYNFDKFAQGAREFVEKNDTHRTVTLRIPKGMTVGKAIWSTLDQRDENCLYRLFEQSDTDLQKALDEVQPNE